MDGEYPVPPNMIKGGMLNMGKKTVAILAYTKETSIKIASQLENILGNYIVFEAYSLEDLNEQINAHLMLVTSQSYTGEVAKWASLETEILVIQRTIRKDAWETLMSIPPRTQVLLVNDNIESALETIALLYELSIKHLDYTPFYPGLKEYNREIKLAITPGEAALVPQGIQRTYDIGDRVIDASTLFDILSRFNLINEYTNRCMDAYLETIMPRSKALKITLEKFSYIKEQLEHTLNIVNDGIIAYDEEEKITVFNYLAEKFIGIKAWEAQGHHVLDVLSFLKHEDLKTVKPIANKLVNTDNNYFVMNKTNLIKNDVCAGGVITLKDVTEVQELERKLRRQLQNKGHVAKYTFDDMIKESPKMMNVIMLCKKLSKSSLDVLIQGKSGSGKELIAHSIHNNSIRKNHPFLAVNCSAFPESLLESELFGYEDGAFTGARKGGKPGLFEQAHQGTIFLDEIGDMPVQLQGRLLRVLQEKEIMRIGATKVVPVDIRVIAATNRNLEQMVREGKFREDLFYRINVLPVYIPPLSERKEDISVLALNFLKTIKPDAAFSDELLMLLQEYNWPGNVRELENCIEYMALIAEAELDVRHLPQRIKMHMQTERNGTKADAAEVQGDLHGLTQEELSILKILLAAGLKKIKVGRRSISRELERYNVFLTEEEVRKILHALSLSNFVKSERGRGGTSLTSKGYSVIENII